MNLRLVHLQLTHNCNLRCDFCGQWGEHGFMRRPGAPAELSTEDWLRVVDELAASKPEVVVWGGEPLLSPAFVPVAERLKALGIAAAVVTNGTLLERHAEVVGRCFETVYVSLDGPAEIHDRVRGSAGVFAKLERGVARLAHGRTTLVALCTLCEKNYQFAASFPEQAARMGFDKIVFQNLIYATDEQDGRCRSWLSSEFAQEAPRLGSWVGAPSGDWLAALPGIYAALKSRAHPLEVLYPPDIVEDAPPCLMPYRHLHVNPDGGVHFCVDFNDFSLGNVRTSSLAELFGGPLAERFRQGYAQHMPCVRCPWRYNRTLAIDRRPLTPPGATAAS